MNAPLHLGFVFDALTSAAQTCPYHGKDFAKLGTEPGGEPRCDSCKQPYRVIRALGEVEQARKDIEWHRIQQAAHLAEIKALRAQLAGRGKAIERHHAEEARLGRHVDALERQCDEQLQELRQQRGEVWPAGASLPAGPPLPRRVPGESLKPCGWMGIEPMTDPALEDRTEGGEP